MFRKGLFNFLIAILIIASPLSFHGKKAEAYGITNHEKVVDAGKDHIVVLKEDGSVWNWGDNTYGQMGADSVPPNDVTVPVPVKKADGNRLLNIKAISAGGYHTVALDETGDVWAWGSNGFSQLAQSKNNNLINKNPMKVPGLPVIVAIAAGDYHTLAVDENGQVWAWGRNAFGQLGRNLGSGTFESDSPVQVTGATDVIAVAAGAEHSIALKRDGTVLGWGRNTSGQLGNGQTTDINYTAQPVSGLTNIMEIAAGDNHTVALKQNSSTVWAWGDNYYGQIGDGGREDKLTPVQVQDVQNVSAIATGDNHTIAMKTDGTVWMWGRNTSGTQSSRTTAVQVTGVSNAAAIGGGGYWDSYTLAITQDGNVWMWDKASSDATTKLPIFKQVSGINDVMKVSQFPFVQGSQVLFRYMDTTGSATSVKVNGSFNDWIDLPMTEVSNNVWELQATLQPGEYNYGFLVDGAWTVDPLNRNKTVDEFGSPLSVLDVPAYAVTGPVVNGKNAAFTYSSFEHNGTLELDAKTQYVALVGSFTNWQEIPMEKQPNNTWAVTRTLEPGNYYYSFIVRDAATGSVTVKRNDPLNPNLETHSVTGISRNIFQISELLPNNIPVTGISLNKGPNLDLVVGEQEYVRATLSPSNASNKAVNWSSSNPSIVSIDAEGKMTAYSTGTAVIVSTTVDGGKTAFLTVTVNTNGNPISYPRAGYQDYGSARNVVSNKVWKVKFNSELDSSTITRDNVYVLNESGIKVPAAPLLSSDGKTLEIRVVDGFRYNAGATYYLFVESTVKSKSGDSLKVPVQMKFTIQL